MFQQPRARRNQDVPAPGPARNHLEFDPVCSFLDEAEVGYHTSVVEQKVVREIE